MGFLACSGGAGASRDSSLYRLQYCSSKASILIVGSTWASVPMTDNLLVKPVGVVVHSPFFGIGFPKYSYCTVVAPMGSGGDIKTSSWVLFDWSQN